MYFSLMFCSYEIRCLTCLRYLNWKEIHTCMCMYNMSRENKTWTVKFLGTWAGKRYIHVCGYTICKESGAVIRLHFKICLLTVMSLLVLLLDYFWYQMESGHFFLENYIVFLIVKQILLVFWTYCLFQNITL